MLSFRIFLCLFLGFQLIGCATIISGSTEKIKVLANVQNTQVFINDVYLGVTGPEFPLEVTVPKKGDVTFVGKKENCTESEKKLTRSIDPTTLLGILIDRGIFSILLVDYFGTNAVVHSDQPVYFLNLQCSS